MIHHDETCVYGDGSGCGDSGSTYSGDGSGVGVGNFDEAGTLGLTKGDGSTYGYGGDDYGLGYILGDYTSDLATLLILALNLHDPS